MIAWENCSLADPDNMTQSFLYHLEVSSVHLSNRSAGCIEEEGKLADLDLCIPQEGSRVLVSKFSGPIGTIRWWYQWTNQHLSTFTIAWPVSTGEATTPVALPSWKGSMLWTWLICFCPSEEMLRMEQVNDVLQCLMSHCPALSLWDPFLCIY